MNFSFICLFYIWCFCWYLSYHVYYKLESIQASYVLFTCRISFPRTQNLYPEKKKRLSSSIRWIRMIWALGTSICTLIIVFKLELLLIVLYYASYSHWDQIVKTYLYVVNLYIVCIEGDIRLVPYNGGGISLFGFFSISLISFIMHLCMFLWIYSKMEWLLCGWWSVDIHFLHVIGKIFQFVFVNEV